MNWKVAGMAGTALATAALTAVSVTAAPSRFTGDVKLAVSQSWEDDNFGIQIFDDSFTSLEGEARVNTGLGGDLNLQLNFKAVGSFTDDNGFFSFDRDASFQGEADLYWQTDRWAFGPFVGGGVSSGPDLFIFGAPSAEYYYVGVQGQYYWETFTLGLAGGWLDSSNDTTILLSSDEIFLNDAWFVNAEVRWYCSPKTSITANVGYISGEALKNFVVGPIDVDTVHWGAKVEYYPDQNEGLSLWVAYEGRSTEYDFPGGGSDPDKDVHTGKIGVTWHWGVDGNDARSNDRGGGPVWNPYDFGAVVVGG